MNGKADINGVFRAKTEWRLQVFEVFMDCVIFGYTLKHLLEMTSDQFYFEAYYSFWIVIDCTLMLFIAPYAYQSKYYRIPTEIIKNIYSLNFV